MCIRDSYNIGIDPNSPLELYDLQSDIGETTNVASRNPEITSQLGKLLKSARTVPANPKFDLPKPKKKMKKKQQNKEKALN